MRLPATSDVVVVGGGIVGVAAAAAIAGRGARVVLVEKEDRPAREASGRAQGSLRVQGRHEAELALALEALELWKQAGAEADIEFVQGGNLYFHTAQEERPILQSLVAEAHRAGLHQVELLDVDQTRELVPCATGPLLGAMWSPVDAHVQPAKGTDHYAKRANRQGAELAFDTKATRILEANGRVTGVDTTTGPIGAGAVVIAAGVWTPYLASTAGVKIPLMPVAMSELETKPLPPLFEQTIRAFGFGARQRPNGRTVISAGLNAKVGHAVSLSDLNGLRYWLPRAMSFRKNIKLRMDLPRVLQQLRAPSILSPALVPHRSPEPTADHRLVDASLARMATVIPAFAEATVERYWAGMVDMTPDGLPIIDAPGPDGLSLITGLCGHGLHLGPALGEIAADLALNGRSTRPIDAFSLQRYSSGTVAKPSMTI